MRQAKRDPWSTQVERNEIPGQELDRDRSSLDNFVMDSLAPKSTRLIVAIHLLGLVVLLGALTMAGSEEEKKEEEEAAKRADAATAGISVALDGGTAVSGRESPLASLGPNKAPLPDRPEPTGEVEEASAAASSQAQAPGRVPGRVSAASPAFRRQAFPEGIDLARAKLVRGRYIQTLRGGTKVEFTLDPVVQKRAKEILGRYPILHGALVAMEPATGRILAWAGRSTQGKRPWSLPGDASPAAASTFKLVTAAALLERGKVTGRTRVCYHGGFRHLTRGNIVGDPRRDRQCMTFRDALAKSTNSVFAHLSHDKLKRSDLLRFAEAFGYNEPVSGFPLQVGTSRVDLPGAGDPLELARAAAGFGHVHQSPLQAASVVAAVANRGLRVQPRIVSRILSGRGEVVYEAEPMVLGRAITELTAHRLTKMMIRTTTHGTARRRFGARGWRHRGVQVAGKTGSLTGRKPTTIHYTWFVGFAPAAAPRIAFAALVGNGPLWHIKGTFLAREVLDAYFRSRRQKE